MSDTPLQVRINQAAVVYDFKPTDYEFEAEGGQYSFPYTAEAALVATPDEYAEGWLTVEVTGTEVVLKAAANTEVKTRASIVEWTIGSAKGEFEVSQKGAPATFEGTFDDVNAPKSGKNVVYDYTTNSELVVNCNEDWIEAYAEEGKLYINVSANSGDPREGIVTWSVKNSDIDGIISVSQDGKLFVWKCYPHPTSPDKAIALTVKTSRLCSKFYVKMYLPDGIDQLSETQLIQAVLSGQYNDWSEDCPGFNTPAGNGFGVNMSSIPDGKKIAVVAYLSDGVTEEAQVAYVHFANGDQNKTWNVDQLQPASSKSDYYGEYHVAFNLMGTDDNGYFTDYTGIRVYGNAVVSDGAATSIQGQDVELVNISGIWNNLYNYRVSFDDTMYYYYLNGLLYSSDQELGTIYFDGSPLSDDPIYTLSEMADGSVYEMNSALVGGIINNEGYIAFLGNNGKTEAETYEATWLCEVNGNDISGIWAIAKDFILIPSGAPKNSATLAAAQKKLAKIKKNMTPSKGDGSYVQRADGNAFARALEKVNAEEHLVFKNEIATCNAM